MTRKHFEAIADILKETNAGNGTLFRLASYFKGVNPNFDCIKFTLASRRGLTSEEALSLGVKLENYISENS